MRKTYRPGHEPYNTPPSNPTPPPVVFLSVREAALLLRCSIGFLYRQLRSGLIPHLRVGTRAIRIHLNDLKALQYVAPPPPPPTPRKPRKSAKTIPEGNQL